MSIKVNSEGDRINGLKMKARDLRLNIIKMITESGSGHPGGSLSAADIVAVLYFHEMRIDPDRPDWPDRDRFVFSKGHACPVWYPNSMEQRAASFCKANSRIRARKIKRQR